MQKKILLKCLLLGVVSSVGALADMSVDKSNGTLTITSDISGTVSAKIIGPNDEVIVNEKYEGNTFSWTISGADGPYRYDVRIVPVSLKVSSANTTAGNNDTQTMKEETSQAKSEYAGGVIEIVNNAMQTDEGENPGETL